MVKKIFKIFFQVVVLFLFVSATALSLLAAYGYQIDLIHKNIVKTSIIDIAVKLDDVKIYIDGEMRADEAPIQINPVQIGTHLVKIEKDGYNTWEKTIKVEARFVSKLNNIVLIPENVPQGMKKIASVENVANILYSENTLVLIMPEENLIDVYNMDDDGEFVVEHINFKMDLNTANDIYLADSEHLVFSDPEEVIIFNLDDKSTTNILIPDEFTDFSVAYVPKLTGFYLNDDNLYAANILENGTFKKITLLFQNLTGARRDSMEVISSYGQTYIKESGNLFHYNGTLLTYVDSSVSSLPSISPDDGEALYVRENGEVILFEYLVFEKTLLGRFSDKIENAFWYDEGHHLFLQKSNALELCDITFDNCSSIMETIPGNTVISFPEISEFLTVRENDLILYMLEG